VRGSSCLGGAVHCVQDDSADFGVYVRRSTAVQCVATKVTTKYPIQIRERLLGFSGVHARSRHDCCDSVTFVGPQLSVDRRFT
jgi:hypothetical protein